MEHPDSRWKFTGRLLATRAALRAFSPETIIALYAFLQQLARRRSGIDYLQVFNASNTPDNARLWFIDDRTHVTALLPSDY